MASDAATRAISAAVTCRQVLEPAAPSLQMRAALKRHRRDGLAFADASPRPNAAAQRPDPKIDRDESQAATRTTAQLTADIDY